MLVTCTRKALEDKVVIWDIGQRLEALGKAKLRCYVGLLLVTLQVIAHRNYSAFVGIYPLFMDIFARVFVVSAYYITLVWTVSIYLAILRLIYDISRSRNDKPREWGLRLDTRSLRLLSFIVPLCCLLLVLQLIVALTYSYAYKNVLYNNFMHDLGEYHTSSQKRMFIDNIQIAYKCCGFHSYQDWIKLLSIQGHGQFPFSCCQMGFVCDTDNIINFLANYKTSYGTQYYSIKSAMVIYKEITRPKNKTLNNVIDDEIPFTVNGCRERLINAQSFYWPLFLDTTQFIVIIYVLVNIRRYSTATSFAIKAMQARSTDFTMHSIADGCPRWTLLRPTEEALWRWQRNYLMQMYLWLVYTGKMSPSKYHKALYPEMVLTVPDFNDSFDKKVRLYLRFLRLMIGKKRGGKGLIG